MNTCTTPSPPVAPLHPLAQAWHGLASRWAVHLEDLRRRREIEELSELNADTLRDIGAPEDWVERAAHQRELADQHLLGLRQWRSG